MTRFREIIKKAANVLGYIYGYGIMLCLFAGGITFIGYLVALVVGGDIAAQICFVIYKKIFPIIILISTVIVLLGIFKMYLSGEVALTIEKKRKKSREKRLQKRVTSSSDSTVSEGKKAIDATPEEKNETSVEETTEK